MGSVIDEIKCPKCEYEHAFTDFYYKTGEEYLSCPRCGYFYSYDICNRPENSEYPNDWKAEFEEKEEGGTGATRYTPKDGCVSHCGYLDNADNFQKWHNENKNYLSQCSYTFKKDNKWFIKNMMNNEIEEFTNDYMEA